MQKMAVLQAAQQLLKPLQIRGEDDTGGDSIIAYLAMVASNCCAHVCATRRVVVTRTAERELDPGFDGLGHGVVLERYWCV